MKPRLVYSLLLSGLLLMVLLQACTKPISSPASPMSPPMSTAMPTATASSSPTGTPTIPALNVPSGGSVTIGPGIVDYSSVHFSTGSNIFYMQAVTLIVSGNFTMDNGSNMYSDWTTGSETLGSPALTTSAAGAGHAGAGGSDGLGNPGGSTYDSPFTGIGRPGSSGSPRNCTAGTVGGASLVVEVTGTATLNGTIGSEGGGSGFCGPTAPGGAGSGGMIFIMADTIAGSGALMADGGQGYADTSAVPNNAGGGGGGYIVLDSHTANTYSGTNSEQGGTAVFPALPGQPGAFNQITY